MKKSLSYYLPTLSHIDIDSKIIKRYSKLSIEPSIITFKSALPKSSESTTYIRENGSEKIMNSIVNHIAISYFKFEKAKSETSTKHILMLPDIVYIRAPKELSWKEKSNLVFMFIYASRHYVLAETGLKKSENIFHKYIEPTKAQLEREIRNFIFDQALLKISASHTHSKLKAIDVVNIAQVNPEFKFEPMSEDFVIDVNGNVPFKLKRPLYISDIISAIENIDYFDKHIPLNYTTLRDIKLINKGFGIPKSDENLTRKYFLSNINSLINSKFEQGYFEKIGSVPDTSTYIEHLSELKRMKTLIRFQLITQFIKKHVVNHEEVLNVIQSPNDICI